MKHQEAKTLEICVIPFTVRFRPIQTVIAMLCIFSYVRKEEPSFPTGHGGELLHCVVFFSCFCTQRSHTPAEHDLDALFLLEFLEPLLDVRPKTMRLIDMSHGHLSVFADGYVSRIPDIHD